MAKASGIIEKDLHNWRLIERFQKELARVAGRNRLEQTFSDPKRSLSQASYLSLYLLGLFNPVVNSMRGLCAISGLTKVQKLVQAPKVLPSSFSEAQHVVDPDLLKQVFEELAGQIQSPSQNTAAQHRLELIAQDGSLWQALPRMAWAEYGVGPRGDAKGVRLHLRFNILKGAPCDAIITSGKTCERKMLREMLVPGQTTVGDRYYGKDYKLLSEIERVGGFFVFRINDNAAIEIDQPLPIDPADKQAGVVRHAWVHLGATAKLRSMRVRLVEVRKDGQHLLLITNHPEEPMPAELVALSYRRRWSIELFFRWVKCILGCRHFFAESPNGVAIQLYLALIAALLIQLFTGCRPTKRMMEVLQMYLIGWATAEEAAHLIGRYLKSAKAKRS